MTDVQMIPDPTQKIVLLVEDDEAVRDSVRMGLVQFGFHVLEAANGDEAAILCEAYQGKVDASVIDMVMPRTWGHEVATRLRALSSGIKVVYISGHSEEFMLGSGVLKAEDVFFAKPFYPSELADKIYEMLGVVNPVTGAFSSVDEPRNGLEFGESAATSDDPAQGGGI